jgi:hypothetical protein
MTYGHAERALAAIRRVEAETTELLSGLPQLDPEQSLWLDEVAARSQERAAQAAAIQHARRSTMGPARE